MKKVLIVSLVALVCVGVVVAVMAIAGYVEQQPYRRHVIAEQQRQEDARRAEQAKNKTIEREPYEPETLFIQGGTFKMGSPPDERGHDSVDEGPVHEVTISDFCAPKTPSPGGGLTIRTPIGVDIPHR